MKIFMQIVLAAEDSRGIPLRESMFPCTTTLPKNQFGVVTRIFKRSKDDHLSALLPTLAFGDEVAFKVGENVYEYSGPEDPIRHLTVVASGLGIVPVLELLQRVLTGAEFEVSSCELLWINDSKEDFIFNTEIEKLELEYPEKFFVARVLDQDISYEDSVLNDKVQDALPLNEVARVAIIAAPDTIADKFTSALEGLQYSQENIMTIAL